MIKLGRMIFKRAFKGTLLVKTEEQEIEDEKKRLDEMQKQGLDVFCDDILLDLKMGPLKDYYQKAYQEYMDFLKNPMEVVEPDHQDDMKKHLERRLAAVRGVIDLQLNLLFQEVSFQGSQYQEQDLRELSDDLKLSLLITNADTLLAR